MRKLVFASSILGLTFLGILAGVFLDQGTFSALLCVFAWSPACIFFGTAIAGLKFAVSVQPKEPVATPKPTEGAGQIKQRMSKVNP